MRVETARTSVVEGHRDELVSSTLLPGAGSILHLPIASQITTLSYGPLTISPDGLVILFWPVSLAWRCV